MAAAEPNGTHSIPKVSVRHAYIGGSGPRASTAFSGRSTQTGTKVGTGDESVLFGAKHPGDGFFFQAFPVVVIGQ